jgi:predicted ribosome quality control (RQC) complex YloA/Tae2 family protein
MASPEVLTEWLAVGFAAVGAVVAVVTVRRQSRKDATREEQDRDATDVASWTSLNTALDREIQRLHAEQDRMRENSERKLRQQREDYEQQLTVANARIAELERDVESLRRLLRPPGGGAGQ